MWETKEPTVCNPSYLDMNNEPIGNKPPGDLDSITYCIFYRTVLACTVLDRATGMESANEDNSKGHHTVDGVTHIHTCGDEHYNTPFPRDRWWTFGTIIHESDVFTLIESGVDLCN